MPLIWVQLQQLRTLNLESARTYRGTKFSTTLKYYTFLKNTSTRNKFYEFDRKANLAKFKFS